MLSESYEEWHVSKLRDRLPCLPANSREWLAEAVQECGARVDELNRELERFGFAVTADLDSWEHLARIIQVEPSEMTAAELYQEALAWVDRVRIEERIRQQVTGVAQPATKVSAEEPSPAEPERENTGWGFLGNRDWENWGVGRDIRGVWHLYHFHRRDGAWKRHRHRTLEIRGGLQDGLAQAFLSGCGQVAEGLARDVWKRYSRGMSSESTTNLVKSAISNLRTSGGSMNSNLTITRDFHITRRQNGQKNLRDGTVPDQPRGKIPRIARLMALAIHCDELIQQGAITDQSELARFAQVTTARTTQIMSLLALAPDIQEAILFLPRTTHGRDAIKESDVRQIAAVPDWRKQRRLWATLCDERFPSNDGSM